MEDSKAIIIEKELDAPIEKVWKALTTLDDMVHWFFQIDEFKLEKGFIFTFYEGGEEQKYLHICRILDIEPMNKLSYSWRYDDVDGDSIVTYHLYKKGNKTLLELVHEGIDSFRYDNPDFTKESFERGWNDIIGISLKEYVENI